MQDAQDADELADAHGAVPMGFGVLYPGTVVAAIAVIHTACRQAAQRRADAARCLNEMCHSLARRGGSRISEILRAQLEHLGTKKFEATLRRAALHVAARAKALRTQLNDCVGVEAGATLKYLGPRAYLPEIELNAHQSAALLSHITRGAHLQAGIGRGDLFLPESQNPYDSWPDARIHIELVELPDVSITSTVTPFSLARKGNFDGNGCQVLATLAIRYGTVRLLMSYRGREQEGSVLIEGRQDRLCIELPQDVGPVTLRLVN